MNDSESVWKRHGAEDTGHDETPDPVSSKDRDDILSILAEARDGIDQLSQDMTVWHERQTVLQDNLEMLIQRLGRVDSGDRFSNDQLSHAVTNLIRTLDERLGRVDVEQRFGRLEQQLERLKRDIQTSHSDLTYVKEKMQVSYGILITVPVLFLTGVLLWLWFS